MTDSFPKSVAAPQGAHELFRLVRKKIIRKGPTRKIEVPIVWEWGKLVDICTCCHNTDTGGSHQRRDRLLGDISRRGYYRGKVHIVKHVLRTCVPCACSGKGRKSAIPITPIIAKCKNERVRIHFFYFCNSIPCSCTLCFDLFAVGHGLYSVDWGGKSGGRKSVASFGHWSFLKVCLGNCFANEGSWRGYSISIVHHQRGGSHPQNSPFWQRRGIRLRLYFYIQSIPISAFVSNLTARFLFSFTFTDGRKTFESLGVKVVHGRPYYPQSQGIVERLNRTLKTWVCFHLVSKPPIVGLLLIFFFVLILW